MGFRDFYGILKIRPDSGIREIKDAYRRMVNLHHPDKHPESSTDTTPFVEIQEAYETLGNPEKRKEYDRLYDKEISKAREGSRGFNKPSDSFPGWDEDPDDLIDEIFSRFFKRFPGRGRSERKTGGGPDNIHYDDLL
jgi:DnaJ-class molecular chaperone